MSEQKPKRETVELPADQGRAGGGIRRGRSRRYRRGAHGELGQGGHSNGQGALDRPAPERPEVTRVSSDSGNFFVTVRCNSQAIGS